MATPFPYPLGGRRRSLNRDLAFNYGIALASALTPSAVRYFYSKKNILTDKMPSVAQGYARRPGYRPPKRYTKKKYIPKPPRLTRQTAVIPKVINSQLRDIRKSLKSDQATHVYRERDQGDIGCTNNTVSHDLVSAITTTTLEGAMANLRYYNPSAPGTLVTADASTGTYTRQIHFDSIYNKLTLINNYQVPVHCTVYFMRPKHDTSQSPTSFYSAGVTDQVISGSTASPLLFMSDINMVKDNWHFTKTWRKWLRPGQMMVCGQATKSFDYDPSNVDTHNLSFQAKYGGQTFIVRCEGVPMHDTTADENTTGQGEVDYVAEKTFRMSYDAGVNLNDISYTNNSSTTFTNAGVTSQVVVDNQSYSKA